MIYTSLIAPVCLRGVFEFLFITYLIFLSVCAVLFYVLIDLSFLFVCLLALFDFVWIGWVDLAAAISSRTWWNFTTCGRRHRPQPINDLIVDVIDRVSSAGYARLATLAPPRKNPVRFVFVFFIDYGTDDRLAD